ncbi:MAG: hypothetical protein ACKV2V_28790 [Blastocatellia bacterium]
MVGSIGTDVSGVGGAVGGAQDANAALTSAMEDSLQSKLQSTLMMIQYQDKSSAIDNVASVMNSTHSHDKNISENVKQS